MSYLNIGYTYAHQGENAKALSYFHMAQVIFERIAYAPGIAEIYDQIGVICYVQKKPHLALFYYNKALKIAESKDFAVLKSSLYNNIGIVLNEDGKYTMALDFYSSSLKIKREQGNRQGIAATLNNMADTYLKMKAYEKAIECGTQSLRMSEQFSVLEPRKDAIGTLCSVYEAMGNTALAFEYYKSYYVIRDSIYNNDVSRKLVNAELNFEREKAEAVEKVKEEKLQFLRTEEVSRKNAILYSAISLAVLVILFLLVLSNRFVIIRKQTKLISSQKELIEMRNRNIVESIHSAKNLQDAILPTKQYLEQVLPKHFCLSLPRDIIGGDFYWVQELKGKIFVVVSDCTGHGIPGALMSMLGYSLLNDIVIHKKNYQPNVILNLLNNELVKALQQNSINREDSEDGMDLSICCIDKQNKQLHFASANQPIYVVKDGKLERIKGDIFSVGWQMDESVNLFPQATIDFENTVQIFMASKGFVNQFGGAHNKKFSSLRFEKLLVEIAGLDLAQQKDELAKAFIEWKANQTQTDDVFVMGIQI